MSIETAPEYLSHKDNRNIQVRLDYILLYRSEIKAKIIRILESWTSTKYAEWYKSLADSKEQKSEPPAEDLWITMSYDQFALFSYGTMQHDTIKQQVDDLVAMKHIERRPNPAYPYGPPQYRINRQELQNALNNLEIPPNLFDLGGLLVSPRKKRTTPEKSPQGGGKKPGGDPGKIPPGSGEKSPPSNNISKNTKNHAKNESAYKGNVSSDEHLEATASTRTPSTHIDSHSHQGAVDGNTHHFPANGFGSGNNDQQPVNSAHHENVEKPVSKQETPVKLDAASDYGKSETPAQPSLIQRPEKPEMPLASAPWNAKTAYLISEAIRGKYYTENQRTNQQNAAKRMFQDYKSCTREQFEEIFRDWATWWRDHDKGFFTMADLMARGQNREVRLQTALDRLEARTATNTNTSGPAPSRRLVGVSGRRKLDIPMPTAIAAIL